MGVGVAVAVAVAVGAVVGTHTRLSTCTRMCLCATMYLCAVCTHGPARHSACTLWRINPNMGCLVILDGFNAITAAHPFADWVWNKVAHE